MSGEAIKPERVWLAESLSASIANLGYPVGMGMSPHPESCLEAADKILAHFHERDAARDAALKAKADALFEALAKADALIDNLWTSVPWGQTHNLDIAALNEVPPQMKRALAAYRESGQ
jgi:hypothetical protein